MTEMISLVELREWVKTIREHEPEGPSEHWCQAHYIILRLIAAYRDMAIRAGEWPCVCEHIGDLHAIDGSNYCWASVDLPCPCAAYTPVELEAEK